MSIHIVTARHKLLEMSSQPNPKDLFDRLVARHKAAINAAILILSIHLLVFPVEQYYDIESNIHRKTR